MKFWPAARWNQLVVDPHCRSLVHSGARSRVSHTSAGQLIELTGAAIWQHPWFTDPAWNPKERRWEATIRSGFVNGEDPIVVGVGGNGEDIDLVQGPAIPIYGFRRLPGEGEPVPLFFEAMGVRTPRNPFEITDLGVSLDATPREDDNPLPPRSLVAVDFYLSVARAAYQPQITVADTTGISGQVVDFALSFNTESLDRFGSRARLRQAPKFPEIRPPTFLERLEGTYQDPGEDRQLVSTVYLLSPPDVLEGEPDETWDPYVKHEIFWNLAHAAKNNPPSDPRPFRFTGTGLPMADMIVGQWLSMQNALYEQILQAYENSTNDGRFWSV